MELSRCYREVSTAKWPRWIEKLLSIYRRDRNFLNGSRSCQEAIETNSQKLWWIEIALTAVEKGRLRDSIDSLIVERYQEAIEMLKNSFSKKRKTHIWMQSSMLLNQRSKQHIKLSKTSLNKEKNDKHLDPKHTHILNKSNQIYLQRTRACYAQVLCCMELEFSKLEYHIIFFSCTKSRLAVPHWWLHGNLSLLNSSTKKVVHC